MGFPSIKYKTGKINKSDDPNQIKTFKVTGGVPFKRRTKRRRKVVKSELEEVIVGWLGGIFLLLPLLIFFIYIFPKFFLWVAVMLVLLFVVKKLS